MRRTRVYRTTGFRLAAFYAGLFAASVLILFAVIYWTASSALRQQLGTNVQSAVAALVEDYRSGGSSHTARIIEQRLGSGRRGATFYLLLDPAGAKVAGNLSGIVPRQGWHDLAAPGDQVEEPGEDSEGSTEHRLLAFGAMLPDGAFLLVGEDTHRIVEVEEAMIRAFGWALAVTILLGALGGSLLSFGFLRRVDAINRTTRAIIAGRLTDRVPSRGTSDELDELATNFNEMLDRLHSLMESLRQVSSDIAHDLRTPLSRLRQQLEAARSQARRIQDYEGAVDEAIADTDAILKTFAALLRIAQIEAGTRKSAFTTIDLSAVFQSIAETYAAIAEERRQSLTAAVDPGIQVRGDRELLTQMLANLVENALRHTPEGTKVTLGLTSGRTGPVGFVADSGPGIPAAAREKVFRRFFRLEESRSTPGSGLGLSLVAAVADLHGIAISLIDNEPGVRVELDFALGATA